MRILLLLIFILAPLRHAAAVTRADSLYNCIDEAIANSSKYIAKRESYIRHIRNMYAAAANPSARYSIALELYREYRAFMSDSALAWLDRAETIARVSGDAAGENRCRVLAAYQCSSTGMYTEAVDILAGVDRTKFDRQGLVDYYMACNHLYGELGYYTARLKLSRKDTSRCRLFMPTRS